MRLDALVPLASLQSLAETELLLDALAYVLLRLMGGLQTPQLALLVLADGLKDRARCLHERTDLHWHGFDFL